MAAERYNDTVYIAAAVVNLKMKDKHNRDRATEILSGRINAALGNNTRRVSLQEWPVFTVASQIYPNPARRALALFAARCYHYFKDAKKFYLATTRSMPIEFLHKFEIPMGVCPSPVHSDDKG